MVTKIVIRCWVVELMDDGSKTSRMATTEPPTGLQQDGALNESSGSAMGAGAVYLMYLERRLYPAVDVF